MSFSIRLLEPRDNLPLRDLIRIVLTEFGCIGEGFAYADPELLDLYSVYNNEESRYWVVETEDGRIVGGGGFSRLKGTSSEEAVCELQKLYLLPETRGHGLGHQLISLCIERAQQMGYREIYLETVAQMKQAVSIYNKHGFQPLPGPKGGTGHHKCTIHMSRALTPEPVSVP